MPHCLFTIGHSVLALADFLGALQQHKVKVLADVRSRPASARFPHFDGIELEQSLRAAGMRYLFLGEELGGRPEDPNVYRNDGLVDYRARRRARGFQAGVERVVQELEGKAVALMCAEEDPITCHRFLMICPELVPLGIAPGHIRKGGELETQRDSEDRLLDEQQFGAVSGPSLFAVDRESALESAYAAQAEKCAFRTDPRGLDRW